MCIVEIHDKDIFSIPNFPSTKQRQESKRRQTKTFVFVVASVSSIYVETLVSNRVQLLLHVQTLHPNAMER